MADYDRRLPPLGTLVAFEAAFRLGNFTRAAEELFTSQATVSRRVRQLEADLGVSLFERNRYDITPTAEAERFAAVVRLSLSELSTSAEELRRRTDESASVTVLTSLSLASVVVAPVIGEMQRKHPDLNVRVISLCEPIETTTEDFDVALQYGAGEVNGYTVEFVAGEAVFPVCAPAFTEGLETPLTPGDLSRLPLLHVDQDDPSWPTWRSFLAQADAAPAVDDRSLVFSSYQLCLDMAEQGDGIALGWERSVAPRIEAGALVRIPGMTVANAATINEYVPRRNVHPHAPELVAMLKRTLDPNQQGESL